MNNSGIHTLFFAASLAWMGAIGCSRSSSPPPPLAVEQIPSEMQRVYVKANPEIKETVAQLTSSLQTKDYPTAFQAVQVLCNLPVATKEQRSINVRAMLTLNGLLQAAQAKGDQRAEAALTMQRKMK